jgi:hypothetical protein
MSRNLQQEYDGRTIYSAAHLAGFEVLPVKGHEGPAAVHGNKIVFNPFRMPCDQRAEFVLLLATVFAQREVGSIADNMEALDRALLPA